MSKQRYTPEFKDEAVRQVTGHGGRMEAILRPPDDEGRYELQVARSGRRPLVEAGAHALG